MQQMALLIRRPLFETVLPFVQAKRFRGKINLRKPRPPHFEKAVFLTVTKPYFESKLKQKTAIELCGNTEQKSKEDQDNPFQRIIAGELLDRIKESRLIGFYHLNPMTGIDQFQAFIQFRKHNMYLKNYGRKTFQMAVEGTPYEAVLDFYHSHNMTVFSPEPNIKRMLQISKKFPQMVLLAAILEGKFVSKDELLHYSTIPNMQTAQAGLVQTLNSIGGQLVSHLNSHQGTLVSHLQQRIKQLEES